VRNSILLLALLTITIVASADAKPYVSGLASPEAVAEVAAGTLKEANASWWGFSLEDSTEAIQAAIDSGAPKVTIPFMGNPWIVRPLKMRDNLELVLEPGVVLYAKQGEFLGRGDSLLAATNASNIKITGYGATIRMRHRDYLLPPYEKAEWRMGLRLDGCTNIEVLGLRIESSGGDGIYIGTTGQQQYCKDVIIRDVVCYDNHRQGISVIGAENLLIENSTFASTWGTAPSAGIDLEPDSPTQRLVNIHIKNCIFENNEGHEVLVYPKNLDETAPPITIRFENCVMRKTTMNPVDDEVGRNNDSHGWAGISVGAVHDKGPGGLIEFVNCTVENTGKESVKIFDKAAGDTKVRFENCNFKNPWNVFHADYGDLRVPILFETRRPHISERVGGVEFLDCHVWDTRNRPVMAYSQNNAEYGLHDIKGRLFVHSPHEPRVWTSPSSTGIDLELIHVDDTGVPIDHTPDADAE
jgi:polygalacturonase